MINSTLVLNINDLFWTIQGEGSNMGRRALFVRMPYCNLSCSWCDTSFNSFKKWTQDEFVKFATQEDARFAVITGGEPTMNKHTPKVIEILKDLKFEIAIETNGTFPIPEGVDFVTCSPKKDAKYEINQLVWKKVNDFKYVIDEGFEWEILSRHNPLVGGAKCFLSPEFNRMEQSVEEILNFIKSHPGWRLNLQTHKWIKIP
jgi:7-carboxy-7-deazaguanine synthase